MLLSKLLKDIINVVPEIDQDIIGLSVDSRTIKPGYLFIAYKGTQQDGHNYIDAAIKAGAVVVLSERKIKGLKGKLGDIAARFYGYPARKMTMIGITGTNGKTSCAQFIAQALQRHHVLCGVIGTLGVGFPGALESGINTTPDAITIMRQLDSLRLQGAKVVAMEVSSHALEQQRVDGVKFDIAIFTNLTQDHLDYHGNMTNYAAAKKLLFTKHQSQYAVINADDEFGRQLIDELCHSSIIAYSLTDITVSVPILRASNIKLNAKGCSANIITPWGNAVLQSNLLGRFSVSNLLAVVTVLGIMGLPLDNIITSLVELDFVPGRMQNFGGGNNPLIIVDFAHTPDALQQVLLVLREQCRGSLWCVFGCGGDRDRGKRSLMGQVAERYGDHIIITDDNPRGEDAELITKEILTGMLCPWAVEVEHDRGVAIAHAIECAKNDDIVLIAGKGHESYQIIGKEKIPFSDIEQVKMLLGK